MFGSVRWLHVSAYDYRLHISTCCSIEVIAIRPAHVTKVYMQGGAQPFLVYSQDGRAYHASLALCRHCAFSLLLNPKPKTQNPKP